jgi:hypothetical protein
MEFNIFNVNPCGDECLISEVQTSYSSFNTINERFRSPLTMARMISSSLRDSH